MNAHTSPHQIRIVDGGSSNSLAACVTTATARVRW
jgi:hypothetical protein